MLYKLTNWLKTKGIPYVMRYATGSSLIFYLLEITNSNPLPSHSYCPMCNKVYWNYSENRCATDNTDLICDGYNIPWQTLWGYGDCFVQFNIGLPINCYNEVFAYLSTICRDFSEGYEDKNKKIKVSKISCVFMLDSEKESTHNFIKKYDVCFLPEQILFRDDVYEYLLTRGFTSEEAWEGMKRVSQGRGLPSIITERSTLCEQWFLECCEKIFYLCPKAHVVEEMLFNLKKEKALGI